MLKGKLTLLYNSFYNSWRSTPKFIRNIIVSLLSFILFLLGIIGTILPLLPGGLFYTLALVVLASEFQWADKYKKKLFSIYYSINKKIKKNKKNKDL
jgi:uncharacterized membrane protein YbaN (DUF454 family)